VPDTILVRFQNANPILITLHHHIRTEGMPATLDKFQILGLLPKQESFQRASATARDTKRQREQAHTFNAMLFHHPFNRHFQPVTTLFPIRRKRSELKLANSISNAVITI